MIEKLQDKSIQTSIRWVPSHIEIEDNEKADLLVKKATKQLKNALVDKYSSFSYI
jgi:ribonuclease HI